METRSTFRSPDHVMSRTVGEELVLLDLQSGTYFGLDPVGARIWSHLQEGCDVEVTTSRMTDEFDVTAERARADVSALIDDLLAKGLLAPEAP
jgi:hypothetical protein